MSEWISVKDRLPRKQGKYLTVIGNPLGEYILLLWFHPTAEKVSYEFMGNKNPIFYESDSEWGNITYDNVTHWMPLPELPKD